MSGNTSDSDEWAWLNTPPPPAEESGSDPVPDPRPGIDSTSERLLPEQDWVGTLPADLPPSSSPRRGRWRELARQVPVRAVAGLAAVIAVAVGVVVAARGPHGPEPEAPAPTSASATPAADACAGLSGTEVTDRAGDRTTLPGVIATFEHAYYTQRSADAAMTVVAPESGITVQSLADGIATIPVGTLHCVAITPATPVSQSTASVHIVELRPDGKRVDYLQVINTITGPDGGLLISHVQGQG
ncbi:hypothetical protein [Nocardia wallacei]|uniref:hypothetical protein n=1 Tax=Nocardia wallacei TaxID=480035 RepID=UPI0024540F0F|nr:hypothetical protein [Nocardia wallacei]